MKLFKMIVLWCVSLLSVCIVTASYSPTSTDKMLVETFSKKISTMYQKTPSKIEKIAPKLKVLVSMYDDSRMEYYILDWLYQHIVSLMNTVTVVVPASNEETTTTVVTEIQNPTPVSNVVEPTVTSTSSTTSTTAQPVAVVSNPASQVESTPSGSSFMLPDSAQEWALAIQQIINSAHIKWNPDAKFSLVEFSDFQCPFCQRFTLDKVLDTVLGTYEGKVNAVFAHFPLSNHPLAEDAALAAECVGEIWWSLAFQRYKHELFFLWFTDLDKAYEALQYINVDINRDQFDTCRSNKKHLSKVQADYNAWITVWVRWTPTVVFFNRENGNYKVIPWANTPEAYADIINQLEPELLQ